MAIIVRNSTEQDILQIILLIAQLRGPTPTPEQMEAVGNVYRAMLDDSNQVLHVAEIEGQIVGVLLGQLRPRGNWLTPELWIADLAVTDNGWRRGAGHALVKEALSVAAGWQCHQVVIEIARDNRAMQNLLRSFEFEFSSRTFAQNLVGQSAAAELQGATAETTAPQAGVPLVVYDLGV
jgi:GNAT superfamily N-acetyltransferase